jgi:predicted N-acetyltransferase YhbS
MNGEPSISKGTFQDYEEIIEVANRAFGCDFPTLLPKLYRNRPEAASHHHVMKVEGRIKALVGSFPLAMQVGGLTLKMRGIGTVCVEKDSRGLGFMRLLMDAAMSEAAAEGCDLAVLGGQRQRYEFWGFTPSGISADLGFDSMNFRQVRYSSHADFTFDEVREVTDPCLEAALALHDAQTARAVRRHGDFLDICTSWIDSLFLLQKEGRFAGYLCASKDRGRIDEMVLVDPRETDRVIDAYLKRFERKDVRLRVHAHETTLFHELNGLCESLEIKGSGCFRIFDYPRTIQAFLGLKNEALPLVGGSLVLEVNGMGRWSIRATGGLVSVESTVRPPDLVLDPLEATHLLFSNAGLLDAAHAASLECVRGWFPLPLFYPAQDMV